MDIYFICRNKTLLINESLFHVLQYTNHVIEKSKSQKVNRSCSLRRQNVKKCTHDGINLERFSTGYARPLLNGCWKTRQRHIILIIAPQAAYRCCSGAFVSQTERARPRTLTCNQQPYIALVCRLIFSTPNRCNYMDYYSFTDPRMMEGWVGLVRQVGLQPAVHLLRRWQMKETKHEKGKESAKRKEEGKG